MSLFSSGEPRDASHVAFGITLLALPVAFVAFFAGALTGWLLPGARELTQIQWQWRLFIVASCFWVIGMVYVLRHYRQVTRHWTGDRRGGGSLVIVECLIALWTYFAPNLHPGFNTAQISGLRIFLDGFLFLSVVGHVAAYVMLGYRPYWREIGAWTLVAVIAATEICRFY